MMCRLRAIAERAAFCYFVVAGYITALEEKTVEKPMNLEKIPQTDSIQELAEFWDTHDLTDFEEQLEPTFGSPTNEIHLKSLKTRVCS
jgi:hypothetical protein